MQPNLCCQNTLFLCTIFLPWQSKSTSWWYWNKLVQGFDLFKIWCKNGISDGFSTVRMDWVGLGWLIGYFRPGWGVEHLSVLMMMIIQLNVVQIGWILWLYKDNDDENTNMCGHGMIIFCTKGPRLVESFGSWRRRKWGWLAGRHCRDINHCQNHHHNHHYHH